MQRSPVYCINLKRQRKRREQSLEFLSSLSFQNIEFVDAVDGEKLLQQGGRSRKISATTWRLTYDINQQRVSKRIRPGKLGASQGTSMWAQHACSESHGLALRLVLHQLRESEAHHIFVCEDDCVLPEGVNAKGFLLRLAKVCRALDAKYPHWCCLLLGGHPRYSFKTGNQATTIPGAPGLQMGVRFNRNSPNQWVDCRSFLLAGLLWPAELL